MTARKAYFTSPHHATIALASLAAAVFGSALWAIGGGVAYVLGWVYVPDLPLFTRWREKRAAALAEIERQAQLGNFAIERDAMLDRLTPARRDQHARFCATSAQVALGHDPRARKLEEMQWTYLRLLTMEQSLEIFLEGERRDGVPILLAEAADEVGALEKEVASLREQNAITVPAKEKLLDSRRSRFEVLRQRNERIEEAAANVQLASAEIERLDEQIKLVRADAVASRSATTISDRIDHTFEHLAQTNRWLSDMDRFRDQLGDVPEGGMGVASPLAAQPPMPPRSRQGQK